ncbi:universal stress protein [Desulfovibrio mangrovi]|uniref:universal stress protein n=1 Tax=Desulfovibrio mangrovi TaxID=2976983 RepID=UPI002245351E|nr:universal stress protein [Desulfovibrio mangrovi]UZP68854.1 universal stress protein [Desulfovibrio mangrovi]
MQIKKILVPVDGSEYSLKATRYAADFSKLVGAEIVLLNCRMQVPPMLSSEAYDQAKESLTKRSDELLNPFREMLRAAKVPFIDKIMEGPIEDAIIELADFEKCDLIVMGSRGHSELEGLLVGSTTHRVLQIAACPVTVVR